ncbi:MAG: hypothetical protein IJ624_05070 [Prevotella sp.]|nr:hypothetical protein [Prevotella sp.]
MKNEARKTKNEACKTKNELFAVLISKQPRRCNLKVLTEAAPRGGHRTLIALRESATAKNEKRKTKNENWERVRPARIPAVK